jgi:hypothetical protein
MVAYEFVQQSPPPFQLVEFPLIIQFSIVGEDVLQQIPVQLIDGKYPFVIVKPDTTESNSSALWK